MALFSLVIERDGRSYSTQLESDTAANAVNLYFNNHYNSSGKDFFGENAPKLTAKNIIYFTVMDGLVNMWLAQAGMEGEYVSVICVLTVS